MSLGFAVGGAAAAIPASASVTCSAGSCSNTFSYKGSVEEWTVPNGVSSIAFTVKGAGGGGFFGSGHGGAGAKVSSTLAVASAAKLKLVAGGGGDDFIDGGYGGGARGGFGFEPGPGGGGGSFVFSEADSLLIAAGGGGGAGFRTNAKGGSGGHNGTAGEAGGASGGGGATTSAGGTAGEHAQAGKGPTTTATGLQGEGGIGAEFDEGGGGGGGGYYGGGGGGDNNKLFESGGGGGGSSTVNGGSSTSYETGGGGSGGSSFESGHNGEIAISFTQPTTATALEASNTSPGLNHSLTYTATVSPIPSGGTVAFKNGGSTISGCSAQTVSLSTGEATCTTEYSTLGVWSVTAEYSGSSDTIYPSSTSSSKQVVVKTTTGTALETTSTSPGIDHSVTYTATVSPVPNGGTVDFTDAGHTITSCSAQVVNTSTGKATCTTEYPSAGVHSIGAEYSGSTDTVYEASTSSSRQVVATASTATVLEASNTTPKLNAPVTYTAIVDPVPSGGTVSFTDDGTTIAGCEEQPVNTTSGEALCEVEYAAAGEHSITAAFSGSPDTAYTGSSSEPVQVNAVAAESPPVAPSISSTPSQSTTPAAQAPPAQTQPDPAPQPALQLLSNVSQPLINTRAVGLRVTCGNASCTVKGEAWVRLPGVSHPLWLVTGTSPVAPNRGSTVTLTVPSGVRKLIRHYMVHHRAFKPQIKLTLTVMAPNPSGTGAVVPVATKEYTLGVWTYAGLR